VAARQELRDRAEQRQKGFEDKDEDGKILPRGMRRAEAGPRRLHRWTNVAAHCKVYRLSAVSCTTRAQQLLRWATLFRHSGHRPKKYETIVPLCVGGGSWVHI